MSQSNFYKAKQPLNKNNSGLYTPRKTEGTKLNHKNKISTPTEDFQTDFGSTKSIISIEGNYTNQTPTRQKLQSVKTENVFSPIENEIKGHIKQLSSVCSMTSNSNSYYNTNLSTPENKIDFISTTITPIKTIEDYEEQEIISPSVYNKFTPTSKKQQAMPQQLNKKEDFKLKFKTEICKFFQLNKSCKFGDNVSNYIILVRLCSWKSGH